MSTKRAGAEVVETVLSYTRGEGGKTSWIGSSSGGENLEFSYAIRWSEGREISNDYIYLYYKYKQNENVFLFYFRKILKKFLFLLHIVFLLHVPRFPFRFRVLVPNVLFFFRLLLPPIVFAAKLVGWYAILSLNMMAILCLCIVCTF